MDSPVADDADTARDYLEHLVLGAISGRSGRSTDVAGRVVAVLLEALTAAGGGERAARYLAPAPGVDCRFELVGGDGEADSAAESDLAQLFEALAEAAADGETGLSIDTVVADGTRRRALEQTEDGVAAYVFPSASAFSGADDAVDDALQRWSWTLSTWSRSVLRSASSPPMVASARSKEITAEADRTVTLVEAVREAMADIAVEVDMQAVEGAVTSALGPALDDAAQRQRSDSEDLRDTLLGRLETMDPAAVAERVAERLAADRAAPLDIDALAARLADAVPAPPTPEPLDIDALAARLADAVPTPPTPEPLDIDALAARLADAVPTPPTPEPLDIDALAARLADAVPTPPTPEPLDIDALAERLAALTAARLPAPEPVDAEALAVRIVAALPVVTPAPAPAFPEPDASPAPALAPAPVDPAALAAAVARHMPAPAVNAEGLAAAVVAALGQVIDTAVATSDVERDVALRALRAASEQLQLQLEGFGDRVKSGTRALEALADSLASGSRSTDAYTERLAQSINASMERLGRRVEQQLAAPGGAARPTVTAGGSHAVRPQADPEPAGDHPDPAGDHADPAGDHPEPTGDDLR